MTTPNPVDVINWQIAELRADIRAAEDAQTLRAIRARFEYVRPWWRIAGFGSAADAMREVLRDRADYLRRENRDWLARAGHNFHILRANAERQIVALTEIIGSMSAN